MLRQVLYSAQNPTRDRVRPLSAEVPPATPGGGVYASHPVGRPEIDTVSGCGFARHRRRPVAVTTRRWRRRWRVGGKKPLYARAIFRRNDWLRLTANSDQPPHTPDASFADAFFRASVVPCGRLGHHIPRSRFTVTAAVVARIGFPSSSTRSRTFHQYFLNDRQSLDINVTMPVHPDVVYNLQSCGTRDNGRPAR